MSTTAPYGERRSINAILYLMTRTTFSSLHRLKMDEVWHFYHGSPVVIVELDRNTPGQHRQTRLGCVSEGLCPQHTVPAGTWFGAYQEGDFALVGCTCGPAFEIEDFEHGQRAALLAEFPEARAAVEKLTHPERAGDRATNGEIGGAA
ncbi:unnamed protein product [Prorocentrum cordatum]|uniref:DUF985 domain-containing protein n=1 Tax=Prorocentrum cordatum TaxID=2364126 RepID=A0ABN9QPU4_9DINO|nr:unnamed protein product [Polarella glacialis]